MLLNFIKSNGTLERQLREWYFQTLAENTSADTDSARRHAYDCNVEDLVRRASELAYSEIQAAEASQKIYRTEVNYAYNISCLKGLSLSKEIAKRNRWTINFVGSPLSGFIAQIDTE